MNVSIAQLEAYLLNHYGESVPEQSLFMKLVEEVGEIADILNQRAGRKNPCKEDLDQELATELADLIHYAVALAAVNHLDLTQTILDKDKKASIKYGHDIDLETFLKMKE